MLDSNLLDAIDALEGGGYQGTVWRVTWASRDPLLGGVGGGRWSPPNGFETLYTSLMQDGAMAEAYHHLSLAPVLSSSSMRINALSVNLTNALTLTEEALKDLGVEDPRASRVDYSVTQSIGDAVHMLDYEGIIVPSARINCLNLVVFLDKIDLDSQIQLTSTDEVNWPAWRESNPRC